MIARAVRAAVLAGLVLAACGGGDPRPEARRRPEASTATTSAAASATTEAAPATLEAIGTVAPTTGTSPPPTTARREPTTTSTAVPTTEPPPEPPAVVTVAYRVERRVDDEATAGFEDFVESVLSDSRGWERAAFDLVRAPGAPHLIVLAEGDEVDRLCLPYDTYGLYSCQNGPVVALNADRWRTATPKWTGDLPTYRAMLVNHEFGHLLGQRHPRVQCPARGRPAPLMAQQSTELNGCLPNPWPLDEEVARAARHDLPIAPPYSR